MKMKLLKFQQKIINDLTKHSPSGDGLVIMAKGMGLWKILLAFMALHADPRNLVLLLNTQQSELEFLKKDLQVLGKEQHLNFINNESNANARAELYLKGGVLSVTSRILIVDLLNKIIPTHLITGIIVNHAHKITETSPESFILRLFRNDNKEGFIKAFSDDPESFANGIWKLEKSMKVLYQRFVYIWPRFHVRVKDDIEKQPQIENVEIRIPMTRLQREIMQGLWDCLDGCLKEIKRTNPSLVVEDFIPENAAFKAFDAFLRTQLDPIWHKVSTKTKNLIQDLKIIRKLLNYLASYDAITFYSFLETLIASSAPTSVFKSEPSSPWLLLDAAHIVVSSAKKRVYRKAFNSLEVEPILEEQPKWKILITLIKEIHQDKQIVQDDGPILIMVQEDRTCYQLSEILCPCNYNIIHHHSNAKHPNVVEYAEQGKDHDFTMNGISKLMNRLMKNYLKWKSGLFNVKNKLQKSNTNESEQGQSSTCNVDANANANSNGKSSSRDGKQPINKRRRVRGGKTSTVERESTNAFDMDENVQEISEILSQKLDENALDSMEERAPVQILDENTRMDPTKTIYIRSYSSPTSSVSGGWNASGQDDLRVLEEIKPRWVILYDPDLGFVRRLELFKASRPHLPIKSFLTLYDNSIEERKYLSVVRKEREAFEKIIQEKSNMVIPIDQDGRIVPDQEDLFWQDFDSRVARANESALPQVIIDLREFRSSLPGLLYSRRIQLKPCTLEVGDYIITPRMCVERKSIPDLVQSLKSGRLYNQAEAMCIHYPIPIVLIEFTEGKSFSLSFAKDISSEVDTASRLVLLSLQFPKLRLIWSSSPSITSEIFEDLKTGEEEPSIEKALTAGVESTEGLDTNWNITPSDILRSLPGVTSKNYKFIMNKVKSIVELTETSLADLQEWIGVEPGKKLFDFIHFKL